MNKITEEIDRETDGRAARWEAHRTARHEELLKLARKAVHKLGPQVSMEDIAGHAKTSKPVYYRYFGDKEGLRQALSAMVINDFRKRVIAAGQAKEDEGSALHAMVSAYLELATNSPNLYFFVTSAPRSAEDEAAGALTTFFEEASALISERLLRLYDQQATTATLDLWPRAALGMVRAAGERWLRQPDSEQKPSLESLAEELTNWLAYGIASTNAPTTR
ncbi:MULTISPECIES: TetR/AcrR family transcriptional regulator [Glutamicibacter]|uniref:TetR-family transcriptional regulator n=1 Tax=Glutamicibacter arilaitensis (strain DSM 16368 / CIP 108037 / IAM 15318 / JCM 13566 / NCIMB 14258 / Re117) TaxID=861360 RepID=A0ABP1U2J1_GLUAR|nr:MULTISPECIES: TetR/AcrR family transcriptional regulator [Glutamicibacter]CBT75829.1 TetR-family transcriptional regulator [Glutamicibacter arilaitensis Re117]